MDKKKKPTTAGGKRVGSGRPKKFTEVAKVTLKCELADIEAAKLKYGRGFNDLFNVWLKSIT